MILTIMAIPRRRIAVEIGWYLEVVTSGSRVIEEFSLSMVAVRVTSSLLLGPSGCGKSHVILIYCSQRLHATNQPAEAVQSRRA